MARRPSTLRFVGASHPLRSPDPEVVSYDRLDGFGAGRVKFEDDKLAGWRMSKDAVDLWKQEFIYLYPDYEFLLPRISPLTYYNNLLDTKDFFLGTSSAGFLYNRSESSCTHIDTVEQIIFEAHAGLGKDKNSFLEATGAFIWTDWLQLETTIAHQLSNYDPNRFVCFICKATAISQQAKGLNGPAIEERLCPFVSTEIEVRRDLAARHIVDDPAKGPGITRRLYEALKGSNYNAARLTFKWLPRFLRGLDEQGLDEELYLWHHGFQCLYRTSEQWSNSVFLSVCSARYMEYFDSPTHAPLWLLKYCPVLLTRAAFVIDSFGAYDPSPSTAFTIETKKEPEDELKYVYVETAALDERVWVAPRYSVEPRFYSHLSVEQTLHVQNKDINSSRLTDKLDQYNRPRWTNELASPAALRLSNELRNNVTMGTAGRSPAALIKASPSMSKPLLYDVPSAMGSPYQLNEVIHSMPSDFTLFNARQERGDMQSFAHYDFPTNGESSQLRYRHNLEHLSN